MDLGLAGKVAIITGGSGGIGRGLVLEFAREGIHVVSASRDVKTGNKIAVEAKRQGLSGTVLPIATDITKRQSVDAMVAQCRDQLGPVDVLVNNAGGVAHPAAFEELDDEARRWEIALNVDGVVNCCQAVSEDMLGRNTGSIINISSNSSLAFRFTSSIGVGYIVFACNTVIFSFAVPALVKIFNASPTSAIFDIPVDNIIRLPNEPICLKYGRFVISPLGILKISIFKPLSKSILS